MLSPRGEAQLAEVLKRYPTRRAALLPLLHLLQEEHGWLSAEAEEWAATRLDLPPVKVHEVVTFYTMFHQRPVGRHHLQLCRTLSCELRGSERLLHQLEKRLGIGPGETSADGQWSLEEVECLGVCGNAPAIQVNDDFHVDLTVEKLERLLADPRTSGTRHVPPGGEVK